jgi:hypothetical protein
MIPDWFSDGAVATRTIVWVGIPCMIMMIPAIFIKSKKTKMKKVLIH